MSHRNKNIVVTGAAGEIGAATILRLLAAEANILAVDRDEAGLARLRNSAADTQGTLETHVADVSDAEQVAEYASRAASLWSAVDGFFNNAGIQIPATSLPDTAVEDFDKVMAVNVRGVFLGLKHMLPLVRDGGSVINSSSSLGVVGAPGVTSYAASKHAIVGITRVAALEQGPRGVRVNAIAPGPIAGEMTFRLERQLFGEGGQTFAASVPLGRHGTPEDVAGLVSYLLSDDASYATGSIYNLDGGFTAA